MDVKLRKRIAEYIVSVLGGLFVAIGITIGLLPFKLHWILFLDLLMILTEGFLIYLIYVFLKVPVPEEPTIEVKPLDDGWSHVTVTLPDGYIGYYTKVEGQENVTTI